MKAILTLVLLGVFSLHSYANDEDIASKILAQHEDGPQIRELNWLNQNFLERQRNSVNELVATHFGQRLRGNADDIKLLQRVVNEELVGQNDTLLLQALGVVIGDVFVKEVQQFHWVIYEDELGPTQAVCLKTTKHCLFPVTMLSRRMEVGLKPDVKKIFQTSIAELSDQLPKTPYSVE